VTEGSSLTFAREDNRGDFVGEDDGGGEGDEISNGTTTGELDGTATTCLSSSGVTRATALLMISMISSSVSRSSTNTLQ
jgi:hypothetical protein